jgi:hypothetical protein
MAIGELGSHRRLWTLDRGDKSFEVGPRGRFFHVQRVRGTRNA